MEFSDDSVNQIDPILAIDPEVQEAVTTYAIPDRALRVEAATLSLLEADDKTAMDQFDSFANTPRDLQPSWISQKGERMQKQYDDYMRTGLVEILGDPKLSMVQKQQIVETARSQTFTAPDASSTLYQAGLISPSKGESETGSKVRESMAMSAFKAAEFLEERQGIVNAAVGKREGSTQQVLDFFSMFVPLEAGITSAKIGSRMGANPAATGLLPGTYMRELSDHLRSLPITEQKAFITELSQIVSASSGLTTSKNQLRTEAWLNDVINGVSTTGEWVENIFNVLDIVGIGTMLKAAPKAAKAVKTGSQVVSENVRSQLTQNTGEWFERTGRDVPMETVPKVSPEASRALGGDVKPQVPTFDKNIQKAEALEAELHGLTETLTNKLARDVFEQTRSDLAILKANKPVMGARASPDQLSQFMQAKKAREDGIAEIQARLDGHNAAVKAEETIPEIKNEIAELKSTTQIVPEPMNPVAAAIDRAFNQSIVFTHNPRSGAAILHLTNPEKSRALHAQILMTQDDVLAEALHGSSRNEALLKGVAPQITDQTGRVKKVTDDVEVGVRGLLAQQLEGAIKNVRDGFRYTPLELASGRANVVKDYTEVTGLKINDAMTSVAWNGDTLKLSGVYTNGQGGWSSAEEAVSQARYALRDRGVTDDMIEVMRLDGDEYVPVIKSEVAGVEGAYAVRLNIEDRVSDADVGAWDNLDVKRNFLDRFFGSGANKHGSANRFIFDPNSSLHKTLTGSMAVSDDKAALITGRLLEMFEGFTDKYVKLPKNVRADVDHYIRDANVHEIAFDPLALSNRFSPAVVDMLKEWRDAWDVMYTLENGDVIRSLNRDGYQLFKGVNIEAVIKERPKRFENNNVYDPASDTNRKLTNVEIDDIYNKGGYVGEFRRPMDLHGKTMEYMIVRNNPNEFARKMTNNDRILNHREGYYQVSYKTPKFIDEVYTDTSGIERTRTVGVAGTIKEAKAAVEQLQTQTQTSTFKFRGDERDIRRSADAYWDVNQSSGRLAQRHRGKLLEDTVGFKTYGADDFIENPADAAVRAATSMGGRIAMNDTIATAKERYMKQYGHLVTGLDFNKQFPASRDQIVKKGEQTTKELADARTTWEYINYMENGYINAMDEIYKKSLNIIADAFGEGGIQSAEKAARYMSEINPTGKIKGAVFAAYLATNPVRQWVVQTNQSLRLVGYSGIHYPKVMDYLGSYVTGNSKGRYGDFKDFWLSTGMPESIQRSNLIRGTLLEAANRQNVIQRGTDAVVTTGRKLGYDLGENFNNMASAAAVFEKYTRAGANTKDLTVRAEMQAEVRALNRNMSFAGDMPYNQNALAVAFTYLQVPHKFLLQWADRSLSPAERARLIAADLTLWGMPTAILAEVAGYDLLPENENVKDVIVDGLQSWFINKSLTQIMGEKVDIDFSSLAPYDMDSWNKMISGILFDEGLKALISNAPAARVLGLGPESRLGYALRTTSMFFKDIDENEYANVGVGDVADAWARMSSGYSNFQEARIMHQLGKVIDKQGRVVDDSISTPESIAKVFGFGTKDARQYYDTILTTGKITKNWQDTAKADAKQIMQMIRGLNDGDVQGARAVAMLTQALADSSNFPSKQEQMKYLAAMQAETQKAAWLTVQEKLVKIAGYPDPANNYIDLAKQAPLSEEDRAIVQNAMTKNFKMWKELEDANKGN